MIGIYDETQKAWWGAPQTALSMEYNNLSGGFGYLVETSHASPGVTGTSVPWATGEQHKADMARGPDLRALVFLIRDRGHGRVTHRRARANRSTPIRSTTRSTSRTSATGSRRWRGCTRPPARRRS